MGRWGLIAVTALAALLAVSCGGHGRPASYTPAEVKRSFASHRLRLHAVSNGSGRHVLALYETTGQSEGAVIVTVFDHRVSARPSTMTIALGSGDVPSAEITAGSGLCVGDCSNGPPYMKVEFLEARNVEATFTHFPGADADIRRARAALKSLRR